jgi:hypothetical protein
MRYFAAGFLVIALVVAVGASANLLLPACGLALRALSFCPPPELEATALRLVALDDLNATLEREVAALERELGALQCTAVHPRVAAAPSPPVVAAPAPQIDSEAWARRDLGVLEGCWSLDSNYSTRNERTGRITDYTEWRMCFDRAGAGRAEMLGTNGVACSGPVTGRFAGDGSLGVTEAGNLQCSDQTFIYRRDLACTLTGDVAASCQVTQPDVGTTSTVRLRRSTDILP